VGIIAQLIKLQDYISRYQWDVYRYSKQFIRVKNNNWKKLYKKWEEEPLPSQINDDEKESPKISLFSKWKSQIKRDKQLHLETTQEQEQTVNILPETENELKQYFLNNLLHFQLRWATSTITDKSFMNEKYRNDPLLKYLLQRFPDNYLIMYHPVFEIKKAPIETEIIFISPIGIEIVHFIDQENPKSVIMAGNERSWTIETGQATTKILSPVIAVRRTEKLIKSMLNQQNIEFAVNKTILARSNRIIYHTEPYKTKIVDQVNYNGWFQQKRRLSTPLKSMQLKATEILLEHTQTTALKRAEWEDLQESNPILPADE